MDTDASGQVCMEHLLSSFKNMHRRFCWQNTFLKVLVALEDDPDVQLRTPVAFILGTCPGFQLLLGVARGF